MRAWVLTDVGNEDETPVAVFLDRDAAMAAWKAALQQHGATGVTDEPAAGSPWDRRGPMLHEVDLFTAEASADQIVRAIDTAIDPFSLGFPE